MFKILCYGGCQPPLFSPCLPISHFRKDWQKLSQLSLNNFTQLCSCTYSVIIVKCKKHEECKCLASYKVIYRCRSDPWTSLGRAWGSSQHPRLPRVKRDCLQRTPCSSGTGCSATFFSCLYGVFEPHLGTRTSELKEAISQFISTEVG